MPTPASPSARAMSRRPGSAPMNKDNVSISYALFTAGVGALCFLAFYWLIDVREIKAWAWPLNVFGANPLLAREYGPVLADARLDAGTAGTIGPPPVKL